MCKVRKSNQNGICLSMSLPKHFLFSFIPHLFQTITHAIVSCSLRSLKRLFSGWGMDWMTYRASCKLKRVSFIRAKEYKISIKKQATWSHIPFSFIFIFSISYYFKVCLLGAALWHNDKKCKKKYEHEILVTSQLEFSALRVRTPFCFGAQKI